MNTSQIISKSNPKSIVFLVSENEYSIPINKLCVKSKYFEEIKATSEVNKSIIMNLPKWVTLELFKIFQVYIEENYLPNLDYALAQKLSWLADLLSLSNLQDELINKIIINKIDKTNVVQILKDAYMKMKNSQDIQPCWIALMKACIECAVTNSHYIISNYPEFKEFDEAIILNFIDLVFQRLMVNVNDENEIIIQFFKEYRKKENIFELLQTESWYIFEKNKKYFVETSKPTLTWKVTQLTNNFYRESEPFPIMGCYWVLSIFGMKQDGTVSITLKHSKTPKEVEEHVSNKYYNNNKFFLGEKRKSNSGSKNKIINSPEEKSEKEVKQEKQVKQEEFRIPNHCIITISSFVRILELEEEGEGFIQTNSLLSAAKAPTVIRVLSIEDIEKLEGNLSIEIHLKMEYVISGILSFISKNFNWLYNDPSLSLLMKNQFEVLLKHKYLNVKKEDDILISLCIWLRKNEMFAGNIKELFDNVNWSFVSLNILLETARNFSPLRTNEYFRKVFQDEINKRKDNKPNTDAPRFSYKYLALENEPINFIQTLTKSFLEAKTETILQIESQREDETERLEIGVSSNYNKLFKK